MCGIAGIYSLDGVPVQPSRLEAMAASLSHRGPDGFGSYISGSMGMAHARLSIIDIAGGAQPVHNENKKVWVVFNGEIFNYVELRNTLEAQGHCFYTRSDTEVLVHLYEESGRNFVQSLNGQFALALWDAEKQSLLLVRDRVGIAPLFFRLHANELIFASEIKAILAGGGPPPGINRRALDQVFTFWAPVAPETLFEGIYELPPGEWLEVSPRGLRTGRYWDFCFPEDGQFLFDDENAHSEALLALLTDATKIRLRSDVPVGAYLSGGLDSSTIAALIGAQGGTKLRTFSIGFMSSSLDEGQYQNAVVDRLGVEHARIECSPGVVADGLAQTVWHTEVPLIRTGPAPMRTLSGFVRANGLKVVLTGEGADEILGGYDLFKEAKVRRFWAAQPMSRSRPLLLRKLYPYLDLGRSSDYLGAFFGKGLEAPDSPWFSHWPRWTMTAQCKQFFSEDFRRSLDGEPSPVERLTSLLPDAFSRWHPFNRAQYLEAKILLPGYLLSSQGDRMLMANGVEGRFPFLDHRVIEFAAALPPRLKMRVLNEKYLLKRAMRGRLPCEVLGRVKQPYRAPDIAAFMEGNPEVLALLDPGPIRDYGYFQADKVAILKRKALAGRSFGYRDNMAFIGILTTQIWHQRFIAQTRRPAAPIESHGSEITSEVTRDVL